MAALVHDKEGTEFDFDHTTMIPWRWQEIVAQLDGPSLHTLMRGLEDEPARSRGIIRCRLQKTERDDIKMKNAGKAPAGERAGAWDFALTLDDGTEVFLHPNYSNTKVEARLEAGTLDDGSGGRGKFKRRAEAGLKTTLRFDPLTTQFPKPKYDGGAHPKAKPGAKATGASSSSQA